MEIFVDFVKAALAASVSSTADKTLSLCSFVFFKKLCDSVTLCLKLKLCNSVFKKQALWNKTESIWNNNNDEWKISVINTVNLFVEWHFFIIFAEKIIVLITKN